MAFWGIEVKPGKPCTHLYDNARGRLRVSQATLGNGKSESKTVVQCNVGSKSPILLCSLIPNVSETCHLELEFEEDEEVIFSVLGPRSVHLSGYYIGGGSSHNLDETDSYGEDIAETDTSGSYSDHGSEDEYDSDFIDDGDIEVFPPSPRRKSGVVIEEIEEDDKPANGNGNRGRLKKKYQLSDSDDANDNSERQLVVTRNSSAVLESEDEDGFPISFSSKKKESEEKSKSDNKVVDEDRKRKIDAISQDGGSTREPCQPCDTSTPSGYAHDNDDEKSKKKKKKAVDPSISSATGDEPSGKLKKKSKNKSAKDKSSEEIQQPSEAKFDSEDSKQQNPEVTELPTDNGSDGEAGEVAAINETDAKKKKKKKKKKKSKKNDSDIVPNQESGEQGISEELKGGLKSRTFANGLVIEELAMGEPDGKRASPGNKVSVNYIGKLKNGTIFDSNVGKRPFKFRLGVGQVIKGWDIGVNGMRVGDKRRLTIPPSFGYGKKRVGKIPANSWLIFDVALVSVQ